MVSAINVLKNKYFPHLLWELGRSVLYGMEVLTVTNNQD
jgi:hypothetical protein